MEIIELLIPCILHLENRVGGKIITMILRKGMEQFKGQSIHYIKEMQGIIQCKVLGSELSPSHWKLNYSKSVDGALQIEPIKEHNSTVRHMMKSVDSIIEASFPDDDNGRRNKLVLACSKYSEAMDLLTLHRILTEEEQDAFQDLIDDFFFKSGLTYFLPKE